MYRRRIVPALALLAVLTLAVLALAGCFGGGGAPPVVDKTTVTTRGLQVIQTVNAKAEEGYDVRQARTDFATALDAYNAGDYGKANAWLDTVERDVADSRRVAERLYYQSSDGVIVSGLLFRPQGTGPWPLIVVDHAGFGTAADFSDVALGMTDKGYLAFAPDFRGSGKSQGVHELAKGEVNDVIAGIDYVQAQGLIDHDRIGIYGQSHGASVSMLVAERDPRIKAVVEEAGFSDLTTLYQAEVTSTDPTVMATLAEALPMIGGTPQQVPGEYAVRSAVLGVATFNAPLLIVHGAQDPLVPVGQAYEMYDAMRAAGKTVEMKIYPDEQHCVAKPANRAEVWTLMFDWFARYV